MSGSPHLAPSGAQVEIVHGDQRAVVVEVGGALRTYRVRDWDVLAGYGAGEMCSGARGQTMIPWPNRLRDGRFHFDGADHQLPLSEPEKHNAIHGLVRWSAWRVGNRDVDRVRMEHVLHPQAGWPFTLGLAIEYRLDARGLTVTTSARNLGARRCPYATGAHPYVTVGTPTVDDAILRAPGRQWLPADERGIPHGAETVDDLPYDFRRARAIGDTQLDTAYTELERRDDGTAAVELRSPDGARRLEVWVDERYRHLMLFTGDALPEPERRRQALGVEPMTSPPNALQTGEDLMILEPGDEVVTRWGIAPLSHG